MTTAASFAAPAVVNPWASAATAPAPAVVNPWASAATAPAVVNPWASAATAPAPAVVNPWASAATAPAVVNPWASTAPAPAVVNPWASAATAPAVVNPWASTAPAPAVVNPWASAATAPAVVNPWASAATAPAVVNPWAFSAAPATVPAGIGGGAPASPSYLAAMMGDLAALTPSTALPPAVANAIMREALARPTTSLLHRDESYAAVIAQCEQTIVALEQELQAINTRIDAKTAQIQVLLGRKQRLIQEISDNRSAAAAAAGYGAILGLFTFGISAVVGAGLAASGGTAIASLTSDLSAAERDEGSMRAELNALQTASSAFQQVQNDMRQSLIALRAERAALAAEALAGAADGRQQRLAPLHHAAARDALVIANLEAQIRLLRIMKGQATTYEATLDQCIAKLEAEITSLKQQLQMSYVGLFSALIDVALVGFGATARLRSRGTGIRTKQAVLAGMEIVGGEPGRAIATLVERLIAQGLVLATDGAAVRGSLAGLVAG